jgi:tRNA pseudouridine55 synthase
MFPAQQLECQALVSILNGQPVRIPGQSEEGFIRLYGDKGFVGLAEKFPEGEVTQLVPRRLVKSG